MVKITRNKVVEENIFGEVIAQGKDMLTVLVSNTVAAQKLHAETMKMSQAFDGSAKAQRELIALDIKSEQLVQSKIKTDQQIQKLEADSARAKKAQIQAHAALSKERERAAKLAEKEAKATREASSEYTKQSKRLNELRKEYKDLLLTQGQETAQMKIMRKEIIALDATLKKVDATVGQHQRSVGNYGKAVGGLRSMLTQLGLGFGVFAILKDAFNIIKTNDEALASLSAITGATGKDLEDLKGKIHDLSAEMRTGITETTKLFEIVGSQMPQYLSDAEGLKTISASAITLSRAAKDTIENSTLALTSLLNQFSLGAEDAERAMNVLAAGSLVGSVGITQLSESMKNAGSVLSGANVSIEESVALLEVLGKYGVIGAEAGTKLRGSILKLQQAGIGYASGQFEINDALAEAQMQLAGYGTELEKDAFLQKTFGAENISTGRILLSNTKLFEEYTRGVTGTNVATEQAAINSDTLTFALDEMKAVWQNSIIEINNGTGAGEGFKDVIKSITEIIPPLVRGLGEILKSVAAFIKLISGMKTSWSNAFTSIKAFKTALADTIDLLLGWMPGVKQMNEYLLRQTDAVQKLTAEQKKNNFINGEAIKQGQQILQQNREEITDVSVLIDALMDENTTREEKNEIIAKLQADYPNILKNIDLETAGIVQLVAAKKAMITALVQEAIERKKAEEIAKRTDKIIELELQKIGRNSNGIAYLDQQIQDLYATLPLIDSIAGIVSDNVSKTVDSLDLSSAFRDSNTEIEQLQFRISELNKELGTTTDEQRKNVINNELIKANAELKKLLGIRKQMLDDALDKEAKSGANSITGSGADTEKGKKALTAEEIRLKKLEDLRREHVRMLLQFEDSLIQKGVDRELIDEMLHEERADLYREELGYINELGFTTRDEYEKTEHALLKHNEAQEKYHKNQIQRIEEVKKETSSVYQTMAEIAADNAERIAKKQEEAIESLRDTIVQSSELLEEFGQRAIDSIDRQIEKIDEAVDASKSREDQLREEAQKRGLDADEAITLERDRQKALLAEKAAMERKKMEIESLLIMLRAFAASVENGQGNPVANIKSQVTDLINFSKNLPGFIDGTETTLDKAMKQNIPGSGNDKYMIKADGKERILNPSLSSLIPSHVTNKELVQSYLFSKAGQRIQSSYENNVSSSAGKVIFYDNSDVVSAINTLPAKMPHSNGIFDSVLGAFVYLEKHGNQATKYIAPIRKRW